MTSKETMSQSYLDTWEDLCWLRDVHGVTIVDSKARVAFAAVLYGNEDSPHRVEVYWRDHHRNDFSEWKSGENGVLYCTHVGSPRLKRKKPDGSEGRDQLR